MPTLGGPNLATGRCTDGEKSKNELQASYRPENLTIRSVKYLNESDFDVKKRLAPQKPAENNEKLTSEPEKNSEKKKLASKTRMLQIVRNARCRSFAWIGAMFEG